MLMGDNGILTKATEAKDDQADATVEEAVALLWNEYQLEIKSFSNERVEESTKIASTEITKIQGEETDYLATTATSFWDFLLTDKKVINTDGIVDVQKLTGQTLDRGNGTDGVTDVYKIELNEETSEYTLKYCVKVGEEESIWNVTEEVNSNVKELTIYLEEPTTIQYEEGMTWGEWLESKYNITTLYKNDDGRIFYNEGKACFIYSNEEEDIDIRDVIYSQIINPQYVYGIASVPQ